MEIAEEFAWRCLRGDCRSGRLDGSTSASFAERLEKLIGGRAKLLVDFSGVDFVTSAGACARCSAIVKKTEGSERRARASVAYEPPVQEILDITGLTPMIEIYPRRTEGLDALSK